MINLDIHTDDSMSLLQENILDDALKSTADIDTAKIKETWRDADKGIIDKIDDTRKETIQKAGDVADKISDFAKKRTANNSSIIARARNSVVQFPVYISQTARVNQAHTIGKLFERVYTTLVQTVLSQNQILSPEEANDLVFLKKYHTNLREAADVFVNKYYESIDDIDKMICESIFYTQQISETCQVLFSVVPTIDNDLILENSRLINEPLTGFAYFRESSDDKRGRSSETTAKITILSDNDLLPIVADQNKIDRDSVKLYGMSSDEIRKEVQGELGTVPDNKSGDSQEAKDQREKINKEVSDRIAKRDEVKKKIDTSLTKFKDDIKLTHLTPEEFMKLPDAEQKRIKGIKASYPDLSYKNGYIRRQDDQSKVSHNVPTAAPVDKAVDAPTINIKDADIKKLNGMLPYTIEATFRIETKNGIDRDIKYIIGIKTVMHLIRAQDLAEDLRELITGDVKTLQKVRYKTGEINFKDYFLNIKGIKADAAKHINYNKRWVNTLKRLGEYNKMNGTLLKKPIEAISGGNVPIPNGTLVLTQPDVTTLTNMTGIDLSIVSNAKKLAKTLFLIGVVIIDDTDESMKVLFPDSDTDWDIQSLSSIDAELSRTDNSQIMKELNRMVNK